MSTIRPEILAFMQAAEALIKRATTGDPLSDEEADELASCMAKIEELLHSDDDPEELS